MKNKMRDNTYGGNANNSMFDNFGVSDITPHYDGHKAINSKSDLELFDDKKDIAHPIVHIKRLNSAAKGERWRIYVDDELKLIIEGKKLSKKECAFLRSVDGLNWLIRETKIEFNSFTELRIRLKEKL